MGLFMAYGSAELGQVASGSATQSLCLGNRKVGSQVVGVDRSRIPRRGAVGKEEEGRKKSQRQNEGKNRLLKDRERETSMWPVMSQPWP